MRAWGKQAACNGFIPIPNRSRNAGLLFSGRNAIERLTADELRHELMRVSAGRGAFRRRQHVMSKQQAVWLQIRK